ncbi:MAG: STAS domain-containing protein [Alphaproteobacteria bacterium]|nr:STAS domain-containing protein [Alphaproteobacteria bacterium]
MRIQKTIENGVTVLNITGRLVSTTAADLETAIDSVLNDDNKLILDFSGVEYMASSGIRTLLLASKKIKAVDGQLILRNVNSDVMYVLEITGLKDFLDIR